MKKMKILDSLKPHLPENEWEAKYLVDKFKTNNTFLLLLFFGFYLSLIIAAASLTYIQNVSQCEFEIDGSIEGDFEFNQEINEQLLENFNIKKVNGKVIVKAPCFFLKNLRENEQ